MKNNVNHVEIFEKCYRIFRNGHIYSNISKKFLKSKIMQYGYETIGLYVKSGKYKWYFIHRLVGVM